MPEENKNYHALVKTIYFVAKCQCHKIWKIHFRSVFFFFSQQKARFSPRRNLNGMIFPKRGESYPLEKTPLILNLHLFNNSAFLLFILFAHQKVMIFSRYLSKEKNLHYYTISQIFDWDFRNTPRHWRDLEMCSGFCTKYQWKYQVISLVVTLITAAESLEMKWKNVRKSSDIMSLWRVLLYLLPFLFCCVPFLLIFKDTFWLNFQAGLSVWSIFSPSSHCKNFPSFSNCHWTAAVHSASFPFKIYFLRTLILHCLEEWPPNRLLSIHI